MENDYMDIVRDLVEEIRREVEAEYEWKISKLQETVNEKEQEIADLKSGKAYKKLETKYVSLKDDYNRLNVCHLYLNEKNKALKETVKWYEENFDVKVLTVPNLELELECRN